MFVGGEFDDAVIHENGLCWIFCHFRFNTCQIWTMLVLSCVVHDLVPFDSTNPSFHCRLIQLHPLQIFLLSSAQLSSCRFVVASAFLHFSISGRPAAVLLRIAVASITPKMVAPAFPKIVATPFLFLRIYFDLLPAHSHIT